MSQSINSRVRQGSAWTLLGYGATLVIRLASSVILARLLFPEAFGLMAIVAVIIQGLHMLSDFGIQQVIIQHERGDDHKMLDTAWTLQAIRGVVLWLLVVAAAPSIAAFYESDDLAWMIPLVGLISLFAGFNSIALHTERRHMRLRRLTLIELTTQLLSTVAMISVAVIHPTVEALVVGPLVAYGAMFLLGHFWVAERFSRPMLERKACRQVINFGKWIFLSTVLTFCVGQGDKLAFGTIVSMETLGVYSIAVVIATIPVTVLGQLGQSVIFPAYCRELESGVDFNVAFFSLRNPFVVFGTLALSLLTIGGPAVLDLLYDERYQDAAWMLQLLLVGAVFKILEQSNGLALLAHGDAKLVAIGSAAKLAAMVVLIWLGYVFWGFPGAIAGLAFSELARYMVSTAAIRKLGLKTLASDLKIVTAWVLVTMAGIMVNEMILTPDVNGIAAALLSMLFALTLWVLLCVTLWRAQLRPHWEYVCHFIKKYAMAQ